MSSFFFIAKVFYSKLQKYLLSEEQLVDNGYPRPTSETNVVSIKRDTIIEPVPMDSLGSNGQYSKYMYMWHKSVNAL